MVGKLFKKLQLQEKHSALKKEHIALQKILNFFYICGPFFPSWIRSRVQPLKFMRIHSDQDPQP
jgi:hypothetical protein